MSDITVLLTSCGGPAAPGVIKSLKSVSERKIRVIGCDRDPDATGLVLADQGRVVASIASDDYIPQLLAIVQKEAVNVLLPASSSELVKLKEHEEDFAKHNCRLACPLSVETYERILNKKACFQFLKEKCAYVPQAYFPATREEWQQGAKALGYPQQDVVVKPVVGSGSRGLFVLREKDSLVELLNFKFGHAVMTLNHFLDVYGTGQERELMLCEYLPGKEYSSDLLAVNGKVVCIVPRLRERVRSGVSTVGQVDTNHEVIKICEDITRILKLHGNINIQLKQSRSGEMRLIEINPRISGTIVLATAAGANLPYQGVRLALGEEVVPGDVVDGTRMIRYQTEIYRKGERTWSL